MPRPHLPTASALLLCLLSTCHAVPALASGLNSNRTRVRTTARTAGVIDPVVARYLWDRSGPMLEEPAGTVSHVYFNGSALVDTKGLAWTMQGTVPQVGSSILYPDGFAGASRAGAGPYSASNYYAGPTNTLDGAAAFAFLAVVNVTDSATAQMVLSRDDVGSNRVFGMSIGSIAPNQLGCEAWVGGNYTAANTPIAAGINVIGCMYDGTGLTAWVNGTSSSATARTGVLDTKTVALALGRRMHSSSQTPFLGSAYQVIVSNQAAGATWMQQQARRFLSLYATKPADSVVTWTRAASQSCQPVSGGLLGTVPAGAPCVTSAGAQVAAGATHKALNNRAFDDAAWVPESDGTTAAPTVTPGQAAGAYGDADIADQIAIPVVSGAGSYSAVCQTITATAAIWAWSIFGRTAYGTANPYVYAYNGATYYRSQTALTTAFSRPYVTTSALTAAAWKFCIGTDLRDASQAETAANTVLADLADATAGSVIYPVVAVGPTPITSTPDSPTVASALVDPTRWCISTTATPFGGGAWNLAANDLFSAGTNGGANSYKVYRHTDGSIYFDVYGSDATLKRVTRAFTFAAGSEHRITACNDGGALSLSFDGDAGAGTESQAGTGALAAFPAAISLGALNGLTGYEFNGFFKDLLQCKSANAQRCK
ncbi:MAG TPA: hypothetical protein DCQ64_06255 [Candidatus Rokubacteria bacterium]|nr:hypothetical protein [Candidatus Rokubacteria bacterium]